MIYGKLDAKNRQVFSFKDGEDLRKSVVFVILKCGFCYHNNGFGFVRL
jgi:hypothetical protein